jgi:hypothetical protein
MGPKGVPDTKTDRPTDRRSKHQLTKFSLVSYQYDTNKLTLAVPAVLFARHVL